MHQPISLTLARTSHLALFVLFVAVNSILAVAGELSVDDFKFDGPNGSQGASIGKVAANHFKVCLGHAPQQPTWCNMLYFQIVRNARGNPLRLDVEFKGGDAYRFSTGDLTRRSDEIPCDISRAKAYCMRVRSG